MQGNKELTPEEQAKREKRLAKRREYYARNREKIRARDNANAQQNREKDPVRYRGYIESYKERQRIKKKEEEGQPPKALRLQDSPYYEAIKQMLREEEERTVEQCLKP